LPYTNINSLKGSADKVVFIIDKIGVMPLPAAIARYFFKLDSFNSE